VLFQDTTSRSPLDSEKLDKGVVDPIKPDIVKREGHIPVLKIGTLVEKVTVKVVVMHGFELS